MNILLGYGLGIGGGVICHEISHAIACLGYGGKFFEAGVMMKGIMPGAYVLIDDFGIKSRLKKAFKNNTYNYMVGMDLHQVPRKDKDKFDQYLIVEHVPCFRLNKDMSNKFYRTDYYMDIDAGAGHMEQGGTLGCYCVTTDDEIYL